ncbi:MAG: IS1595 family transposase [Syntrophorhabdales bacterium]
MEDYPRTVLELEDRFATEQACWDYLLKLRWPEDFVCPRCGQLGCWTGTRGRLICRACRYQGSVTAGTIFQDTRKPLRMWFRAVWHVTSQKNGASAVSLQQVLGLGSYLTAWTWLHKLRRAMVRPGRDRLRGTVEVDETYWGGEEEGVIGRRTVDKAIIVVAAEEDGRSIGRIRLARIPDLTRASLHGFIAEAIEPGSVVRTDGLPAYKGLNDYAHDRQVQRLQPEGEHLLPRVHRVVSLLKRWLLGTHQGAIHKAHLDYYLDEFAFRFNRRTSASRGKLFYRLLQQAVQVDPVPYKGIVGGKPINGEQELVESIE